MGENHSVYNQALAFYQNGQPQNALPICEELIRNGWDRPEPFFLAGLICRDAGEREKGLLYLHQAQFMAPDRLDYLLNLGTAYHTAGQTMLARSCYERILAQDPGHPDACNNLGKLFMDDGDWENALAWFQKSLLSKPDYYQAHFNMGVVLQDAGRLSDAADAYEKCLACFPDYPFAGNNLGIVYQRMGALKKAAALFEALLRNRPDYVDAWNNLGSVYQDMEEVEKSIGCYKKVVEKRKDVPDILANLVSQLQYACAWDDFSLYYQRLMDQTRMALANGKKPGITPFSALKFQDDPELNQQISISYARGLSAHWGKLRFGGIAPVPGAKRLRIGYVSDDFHNHAVGHILSPLFEHHDRTGFEVVIYSHGGAKPGDIFRERIVSGCDRFVDITGLGIHDSAKAINDDGIDILVDLKGYTRFGRLGIFALRPAPIQVSYLGFLSTTGADFMDYMIADPVVVPENEASYYTEKIVYLPCYQVTDYSALDMDQKIDRKSAGLPEDAFVMCSFNQPYKYTPRIFDVWMRVMHQIPESVLWLRQTSGMAQDNLKQEAENRGIPGNRLIFAPKAGLGEHLARLALADLALDPPGYNGGATTSNALWAGVPVVTCPGRQFVARMSASSLHAIGMDELITGSLDDYEALCVRLGRDASYRADVRARLDRAGKSSALFNVKEFVRQLESAFKGMWESYTSEI